MRKGFTCVLDLDGRTPALPQIVAQYEEKVAARLSGISTHTGSLLRADLRSLVSLGRCRLPYVRLTSTGRPGTGLPNSFKDYGADGRPANSCDCDHRRFRTAGHRRSQADLRAKSSDHQIGAAIGEKHNGR